MSNLLAARWQMAISLGFHIIFAVIGIALPLLMVIAEALWLRTKDPVYRILAQRWARGAAILFAVGAVSGTVLSFELGLLWPKFMEFAGAIIGPAFSLEGFAFFTEAIFLGIYIYGWDKVGRLTHLFAGTVVAASGAASGALVVLANAWMNTPQGFKLDAQRKPIDIDPIASLFTPSALSETLHMTLAAYAATGLLVAGVHAVALLRDRTNPFHRHALMIALFVGGIASVLQPLSGDYAAKVVAKTQPVKLAAMEGQFETENRAPLRIGGIPFPEERVTRYSIDIPGGLSFLAYGRFDAQVKGLNEYSVNDQPDVRVVHPAFQVMVGCGSVMMLVVLWAGLLAWRQKKLPDGRLFLRVVALTSPLGMIAIEAGWIVTEVGRQPWIVHQVMRTSEAVTPVRGIWISLIAFAGLYLALGVIVAKLLLYQFRSSPSVQALNDPASLEYDAHDH
ncbi:cytochrome ubiquinol oxidase subunit I [Singulisphaera sp. PoT]|uniref:cytochrome ubiquinol oxidase subunit I n=1 Tax=Singulisphaera sp. PoT TaxID=3411797 RepID=UPI003BF5DFE4